MPCFVPEKVGINKTYTHKKKDLNTYKLAKESYSGIKIYNHVPTAIKDLSGDKNKFKLALKRYLLHYSFYSLEEYFNT